MSCLLGTNVLAELRRREPDARVVGSLERRPPSTLLLSVLTVGKLRKDVEALSAGERKQALDDWLATDLPAYFAGRTLPIDARVAERWGRLFAPAGRALPAINRLLAAAELTHGLTLVTRNARDVRHPGLAVIAP